MKVIIGEACLAMLYLMVGSWYIWCLWEFFISKAV